MLEKTYHARNLLLKSGFLSLEHPVFLIFNLHKCIILLFGITFECCLTLFCSLCMLVGVLQTWVNENSVLFYNLNEVQWARLLYSYLFPNLDIFLFGHRYKKQCLFCILENKLLNYRPLSFKAIAVHMKRSVLKESYDGALNCTICNYQFLLCNKSLQISQLKTTNLFFVSMFFQVDRELFWSEKSQSCTVYDAFHIQWLPGWLVFGISFTSWLMCSMLGLWSCASHNWLVCTISRGMFATFQRTTKETSSCANVFLKHLLGPHLQMPHWQKGSLMSKTILKGWRS